MSKQTFDFSEALKRAQDGKQVKRKCWFDDTWFYVDSSGDIVYHYWKYYGEMFFNNEERFFSLEDILATDWEEVEE